MLKKYLLFFVLLFCLLLAATPTLHHDSLDGYVANEHIDWTAADADFNTTGTFILATSKTPASAYDTGTTGHITWDSSYIYVCVDTDAWKRAAISSWGVAPEYLLLETGDTLLLETGDKLKLESSS